VPDVLEADWLLLLANDPGGVPVIVAVAPGIAGLVRTAQPVLDSTRRLGAVTAEDVEVRSDSVWRFDGDPDATIRALLDPAAVAVACDSLGLSEAMLDATVSYVGVREQFGRPVGSFQAVKHACADMLVQIRVSRQLVAGAVHEVARGGPGASVPVSNGQVVCVQRSCRGDRQGDAVARRDGLHVGGRHPCVPQAGGDEPVAVGLADRAWRVAGRPVSLTRGWGSERIGPRCR